MIQKQFELTICVIGQLRCSYCQRRSVMFQERRSGQWQNRCMMFPQDRLVRRFEFMGLMHRHDRIFPRNRETHILEMESIAI